MSDPSLNELRDKALMTFSYTIGALSREKTSPSNIREDNRLAEELLKYHHHLRALFDVAQNHSQEYYAMLHRYMKK